MGKKKGNLQQNENMNKFLLLLFLGSSAMFGQTRIDGTMSFQTDPNKKYSIYIPSAYSANSPNKMMLALHPWNTSRWDAKSWCDTLVNFAEANNLIIIAPDGGADGQVDDAIDTAFTTMILDSMEVWYSIDTDKVYTMGFSWGGKTTYTYGLNNAKRFGGFIPIGAAINGAGEISSVVANADNEAFYVVHGGNDSPNTRFNPLLTSLNNNNAIVESILLPGVGHTIDFPNRNAILSRAFLWVDSVNCEQISGLSENEFEIQASMNIFPNPIQSGESINIEIEQKGSFTYELKIIDLSGRTVLENKNEIIDGTSTLSVKTDSLESGKYILILENAEQKLKGSITIK